MMACYQTSCSPLGLPPSSEKLSRMNRRERELNLTLTRTSSLPSNTFIFTTYNQAYFFFLSSATSTAVICFAIQQVAGRSTTYGDLELYEAVSED